MRRNRKITIESTNNTYSYATVYPHEIILTKISLTNDHTTGIKTFILLPEDIFKIKEFLQSGTTTNVIRDDIALVRAVVKNNTIVIDAEYKEDKEKACIEIPVKTFNLIAKHIKKEEVITVWLKLF